MKLETDAIWRQNSVLAMADHSLTTVRSKDLPPLIVVPLHFSSVLAEGTTKGPELMVEDK